jgi:exopolysaccharide biosynthesis polyprenyl glycosylphosphotransferase
MLLRLPWLSSRKRLLASVVIDSCLFSLLYIAAFLFRFGSLPGVSIPVAALVALWLLSSYVIGRYQIVSQVVEGHVFKLAIRTAVALSISIGSYLGYFWVAAVTFGPKDSRGFLLPLLLAFAILSATAQALLARAIRSSTKDSRQWLFLGERDTFNALKKHMAWRRLPDNLIFLAELDQLSTLVKDDCAGVLVSDYSALPLSLEKKLLRFHQNGISVLSIVAWCELVLQRFPPDLLTNVDLLRGEFAFVSGSIQLRLKRLGDVVVSACLLLLAAPILVLASLLIRLQDGGTVLYSQFRSGLGGKPYRVWKLRTMRVDAERHGAQWVSKGDSRITPLGSLLRLTRLDELPQLWSVFKGEMSLIGPRPERPEFEQDLEHQIPHYRLRHLMRPGLSGWAQVNYPYGASVEDAANKLSYDLYYLRNFSFWLDLLILFKTIRLVFNAQGAVPISLEASKP